MKQAVFTFTSSADKHETMNMIELAVNVSGGKTEIKNGDLHCVLKRKGLFGGMKCIFRLNGERNPQITAIAAYNEHTSDESVLTLKKDAADSAWENFAQTLIKQNHGRNFGISAGELTIAEVLELSENNRGLGRGLFGFKNKEKDASSEEKIFVRLRMSNGRLREGKVAMNSKEYRQISKFI